MVVGEYSCIYFTFLDFDHGEGKNRKEFGFYCLNKRRKVEKINNHSKK